MIVAIILVVLFVLYLLSLRGRRNAPGWEGLLGWKYAHRGLHDEKKPENSLAAFRAALEHGYGAELDLHLLADGNLGVMHDSDLVPDHRPGGPHGGPDHRGPVPALPAGDFRDHPAVFSGTGPVPGAGAHDYRVEKCGQ